MMKSNALKYPLVLWFAASMFACESSDRPNIEVIQDMMKTPALKAQSYDEDAPHHSSMRVPADNTVPVGFTPYKYPTSPDLAAKELKNPLAGNDSQQVMYVGMKYFETNCAVCHGHKGEGGEASGSTVSQLMALKPPSLLSDKIRNLSDGGVYHIITVGQGVMGPYASHIPQSSRWQVVNYIRQLQKKAAK